MLGKLQRLVKLRKHLSGYTGHKENIADATQIISKLRSRVMKPNPKPAGAVRFVRINGRVIPIREK